jgi:hypothetical protein
VDCSERWPLWLCRIQQLAYHSCDTGDNQRSSGVVRGGHCEPLDRRLIPDLLRGMVNLIGGELDVDDPRF